MELMWRLLYGENEGKNYFQALAAVTYIHVFVIFKTNTKVENLLIEELLTLNLINKTYVEHVTNLKLDTRFESRSRVVVLESGETSTVPLIRVD
ncbi:CLUMA_CG005874, isoform A [Clunio marinus]|uniref:CLUMA_CG005874, isoform A n=1 Tax=Clunio marinus TaxID=568069 RepID=A0A1J1HW61_9DIPT|nr:CLUMA_CG005874, isoform A [Clunio marinus]